MTLRDYLSVVRRRWLLIAAISTVAGVATYGYYKPQKPIYSANAVVEFRDPAQNLGLVGIATPALQGPAQLAAASAQTVTRPEILLSVQRRLARLGNQVSTGKIAAAITASVDQSSSLLNIMTKVGSPVLAQNIANAVAQESVIASNKTADSLYSKAATAMRRRLPNLVASLPDPSARLYFVDQLQRLQSLAGNAQAANIAASAQLPPAPVAPRPLRNAAFGLLIGLILGLIAAYGAESLDRRLHNASEIQDHLDAPFLGQVRAEGLGRVASFAGGDAEADLENFRIMWRNTQFLNVDSPPRAIAITSALPEEGKSTVAASLAAVSAASGKRVLLLECDLRRPSLADRLALSKEPGLTDCLAGQISPHEAIQTALIASSNVSTNGSGAGQQNGLAGLPMNFDFLAAGRPSPRSPELLSSDRFAELLAAMRDRYDVVLLDTSPLLPVADTLGLIPQVDGLIFCVRARQTTKTEALAARHALSRIPHPALGVVVTGVTRRDEHEYYGYSYSYAYAS